MKSANRSAGMLPLILTASFYIAMVVAFAAWSYLTERSSTLAEIDQRLLIGAGALTHILPHDYHDRATDSGTISSEEYMHHLQALTDFTRQCGFMYAYTVIRVDTTVYFTSSNASDKEVATKEFLTYFTRYDEVSPAFRASFDSATPVFISYTDRWGTVRSALMRLRSPGGRIYIAGVDYRIDYIDSLLRKKLLNSLSIAVLLLLASLPVFVLLFRRERSNARQLRKAQDELLADTAQRLATECSLRESEQQLHQAQKMESIGRLAGGVAHDFNNMLTGIIGTAEHLLRQFQHNKEVAEDIGLILHAGSRAAELTRNLLDFSHKGKQTSSPFTLHDSIHSAIELLRRSIDKRITICSDLQARTSVVYGDPSQILNVFINLGVNARDAMPDGGTLTFSTRTVHLTLENSTPAPHNLPPGPYLSIDVCDTGSGIDPKDLPHIFEPFFTTKPQGKGTGLGLAAVYSAIRDHHGDIAVKSEPGKGTIVSILLPVADATTPVAHESPSQERRAHENILVIDDEPIVRRLFQSLLSDLGYHVSIAEDGTSALEFFRDKWKTIDLVFLDMMMPDMSGTECYRKLKEVNPRVRTVICTGYSAGTRFEELLNQGVAGILRKPFSFDDLKEILAKTFGTTEPAAAETVRF